MKKTGRHSQKTVTIPPGSHLGSGLLRRIALRPFATRLPRGVHLSQGTKYWGSATPLSIDQRRQRFPTIVRPRFR